jgi:acetyl esterase
VDWLHEGGAAALGIDAAKLAIGGDSAGGNLSVAAALRLRDRGTPDRLKALLLNYGTFSTDCTDEAEARFGGQGAVLQKAEMDHYYEAYLGAEGIADPEPYAAPLLADLKGLPPAFLAIPECDLLCEQSYAMAERMKAAGVDVTSVVYPGATHSFLEAMSISSVARRAIEDGARWVRNKLSS